MQTLQQKLVELLQQRDQLKNKLCLCNSQYKEYNYLRKQYIAVSKEIYSIYKDIYIERSSLIHQVVEYELNHKAGSKNLSNLLTIKQYQLN